MNVYVFIWMHLLLTVSCIKATGPEVDIHSMLRQLDIEENDPRISLSEKMKLDEYRKTMIKREILRRLGLERAPNITHIPPIPKQVLEEFRRKSGHGVDDVAPKEIIVVAEPGSSPDLKVKNAGSQYLRFQTDIKLATISSVTLVLRRNPKVLTKKLLKKHHLLAVRIIGVPHRLAHSVGHPKIIDSNRNWIKLDVTSILKTSGGNTKMANVTIEVTCKKCESEKIFLNSVKQRPILIFRMKQKKIRTKRATSCYGSVSAVQPCCLRDYNVNFKQMGYKFVVIPKTIRLNYCTGACNSVGGRTLFFRRINILNASATTNPNDNCCSVSKMLPLSMLYRDEKGKWIKLDLPNVTATDCHCA